MVKHNESNKAMSTETIAASLEQQNISLQPVVQNDSLPGEKYWNRVMVVLLVLFALTLLSTFIFSYYSFEEIGTGIGYAYDAVGVCV